MDSLELILEDKGYAVHTIGAGATVLEAVSAMCALRVGALLVTRGGDVEGIFSERDVMARVVLAGLEPARTLVQDVMTRRVIQARHDASPHEVMDLMTNERVRHVPVVKHGGLIGIVSIGDLVRWAIRDRDTVISQLQDYVTGRYPG
jgi:CBS domain-containing protein